MTDKENRHSPGFQVAHNLVQSSYFASRENGGRFIEDQELRPHGEGLGNFYQLPLGHPQLIDRRFWLTRPNNLFHQTTRTFLSPTPPTFSPARPITAPS